MRYKWLVFVAGGLALLLALFAEVGVPYVWQPVKFEGMSMRPAIDVGDRILVYRLARTPSRGDLVMFRYPRDETKTFVKRVVGLPGETIRIDGAGTVHINGRLLSEPYVKPELNQSPTEIGERLIPPGTYFVIGDNRDMSNDSRHFGAVHSRLILGKVVMRYWPPGRPLE